MGLEENSIEPISSTSVNELSIPRWLYFVTLFVVILFMFVLIFQHDIRGAVIALFFTVVLIYNTFQNQQIEDLHTRVGKLEERIRK